MTYLVSIWSKVFSLWFLFTLWNYMTEQNKRFSIIVTESNKKVIFIFFINVKTFEFFPIRKNETKFDAIKKLKRISHVVDIFQDRINIRSQNCMLVHISNQTTILLICVYRHHILCKLALQPWAYLHTPVSKIRIRLSC